MDECAHKLTKLKIRPGQEAELCTMLIECCAQERTYLRFYGLLGERFSLIEKQYQVEFDELFAKQYMMIHRLETNKLRNSARPHSRQPNHSPSAPPNWCRATQQLRDVPSAVAKFFAHLLHTDALPWGLMEYIVITEDETTSSSRIFVKILFQEIAECALTMHPACVLSRSAPPPPAPPPPPPPPPPRPPPPRHAGLRLR